ncbi:MAG: iron complex outermembrane receptor protein [Oleiphilaceae bacterium]|jgi:iron complex outermembrane receptor protein
MKNLAFNLQKMGLASALISVQMISSVQAEEPATESSVQLDKVVISAHSFDQGQNEMAQPATLLTDEALKRQRANSLGETLSSQAGIHNSSYGSSVGRPVVRGMSGARVKVLQDGIDTLDVSTISPDHGVNADTQSATKIEVLRGPATLMYGSGAFGGVVNVVDERIPTGLAQPESNVRVQYDTVNKGKTAAINHSDSVDLSAGNAVHWRVSASHFRSDEYELPELAEHDEHEEGETEEAHEEHAAEDTLGNSDTSYSNNLTFGSSYVFPSGYAGIALSESKSEYGLPGHVHEEEHVEGETVEEHEEHESEGARIEMRQRRIDLDSRFDQPIEGIDSVKFRIGFNDYRHDEIEDGAVGTKFRRKGLEGRSEVLLAPVSGLFQTELSQAVGIQFSQDTFKAVGEESLVPKTDSSVVGVFWLGKTKVSDWGIELGARLEQAKLSPDQPDSINASCESEGLSIDQYKNKDFNTHSLSLGLVRDLNFTRSQGWQVVGSVTSAQRAPATEELFSCGAHPATQTFDVGNPDLNIEQALNIEVGVRKTQGQLTTALNVYQNQISDFIYAKNTGIEVDGFGQYKFVQQDATFVGGELEVAYQLLEGLTLTGMADRVRADDLPRIPADRLGLGFEASSMALFSTQSDWMLFGQWQQIQKQDQVAENEEASLGYDLLTLGMTYQAVLANSEYRIDLKGNNLLDEEVRQHTSFVKEQVPQPGRNISLALGVKF